MLARSIARVVAASIRYAAAIMAICIIGGILLGTYAATHLSVDTDTNDLISPDLPWRKREAEFDRAFPQNVDLLVIVIDAATPGQAEDAARTLTQWLRDRPSFTGLLGDLMAANSSRVTVCSFSPLTRCRMSPIS